VSGTKTLGYLLELGVRSARLKTSKHACKRIIGRQAAVDETANDKKRNSERAA
jgi:hypothetical protein